MGGARRAIFADVDGLPSVTVEEGEKVGPYKVTGIAAGVVRLAGPEGEYTISPGTDAGLRARWTNPVPPSLADAARHQAEADNDK